MMPKKLCGPVNCAAGSGRLGETLQQVDIPEPARILLDDVSNTFSIIVAIFGQRGSHGLAVPLEALPQQPAIATAGEASRPSNKKRATSLKRIFTINTELSLHRSNPIGCDLNHTRMLKRSHQAVSCAKCCKDAENSITCTRQTQRPHAFRSSRGMQEIRCEGSVEVVERDPHELARLERRQTFLCHAALRIH